jgi:hypothetical protein
MEFSMDFRNTDKINEQYLLIFLLGFRVYPGSADLT